jgi:hypothetical protein
MGIGQCWVGAAQDGRGHPALCELLQSEIGCGVSGDSDFFGLELFAFMPSVDSVLTIRDVGNGVCAVCIRLSEVRSRRNNDVA